MASPAPQRLTSPTDYQSFIDKFDTFLFDCDGVLWHGDDLEPGVVDVLAYLRQSKKNILFVTNNATKSRAKYKGKFDKLGVQAEVGEIFGSAYASAVYIAEVLKLPKDEKVYVIGESGIEEELDSEGLQHIGGTDPEDCRLTPAFSLSTFTLDPKVTIVLAGLDTAITYTKLSKAFQYLTRNPGCRFVATNEDSTYPASGGTLPGAGAISAPLRYATRMDPVAVGKPHKTMMDCIKAKQHFDPARTVMIGDRIDTDIAFGKSGGVSTLLVLSGVSKESDLEPNAKPLAIPDFIMKSLGDMAVLAK
ncbi:hypothetical protein FRB94_006679 [Tulasnella sp. JGI-2019a]|nr:hypothetical protein FRB93_008512 [Tulasnella sp. JGI-2019a]KAG8998746.1 hypothetical protein FRB94_006679 [Tulasnella sp. JGI-2019a]